MQPCLHLMLFLWKSCWVVVVATVASMEYTCTDHTDCHNGGICQASSSSTTTLRATKNAKCQCPTGFSGPRCTSYCPRSCQNGGICTAAFSSSSRSSSSSRAVPQPPRSFNGTDALDQKLNSSQHPVGYGKSFMEESVRLDQEHYFVFDSSQYQCKCKGYWTGESCEIPYVNCGGGKDRRCYHGGSCVYNSDYDSDPTTSTTTSTIASRVGCHCPDGYDGESCQKKGSPARPHQQDDEELSSQSTNGMSQGGKISLSLMLLLAATCLIVMYNRKRRATARRLLQPAISNSRITTLPHAVQDTNTMSTSFMLSHNEHDHENDDDDESSSSSSCSKAFLPSLT
jgi:hypothetical protein